MSNATLTLLGLYQYGLSHNVDMFEHLVVPDAVDHETLVNNILYECGMYELLQPDLEFMCNAMDFFSKKWSRTFEKWVEVLNTEYKPLANYDRIEQWSDSASESTYTSMSENYSHSENISSYNSDVLKPNTSAADDNKTAGNQNNKSLSKHDGHIWGNIGVMTTQTILKEEMEVDKINIYDQIMIIFAREFLIPFTY